MRRKCGSSAPRWTGNAWSAPWTTTYRHTPSTAQLEPVSRWRSVSRLHAWDGSFARPSGSARAISPCAAAGAVPRSTLCHRAKPAVTEAHCHCHGFWDFGPLVEDYGGGFGEDLTSPLRKGQEGDSRPAAPKRK